MSDPEERVRERPSQPFAGSEHLFDLVGDTEKLRNEPGGTKKRHRQITLFRGGGMSLVLFDFDAGGGLSDHAPDGFHAGGFSAGTHTRRQARYCRRENQPGPAQRPTRPIRERAPVTFPTSQRCRASDTYGAWRSQSDPIASVTIAVARSPRVT